MQHDDPARTPENDAAPNPSVDMNVVQDHIQQLTEKSGKIKGINKSRIETDILESDIASLLASVRLVMSREASVELLKFIKFKVSSGQLSANYFRAYKKLLEEKLLGNLINAKLSDDERFTVLAKCVFRLIHSRPLTFYGPDDTALFRDGSSNTDNNDFVNLANNPALLIDYISYSEMEFSRRIALSAFTHLYKFTGTGYNKISAFPVFIHAHSGIRLERVETPEYKKLFVSEKRNPDLFKSIKMPGLLGALKKPGIGTILPGSTPQQEFMLAQEMPRQFINLTLYKSMLRELIENYFADCNRAGVQAQKNVHLRLMPIDMADPNYVVAGLAGSEKAVISALIAIQGDCLKAIVDQADFVKKYPKITAIELRKLFWERAVSSIQNPLVTFKPFAVDDMLAELTDPIANAAEKGSTSDTLLCVNLVCSANAYTGNRIYKNSLSSIEAEFANRSNITTLLNPIINPALLDSALLNHLLIRFPSGKLSSLTEIKEALIQAANTAAAVTTTAAEQPPQQPEHVAETAAAMESKPTAAFKFKFKLPGNPFAKLKPFFARFGAFFKLIADIFRHVKAALIEIINSKRKH